MHRHIACDLHHSQRILIICSMMLICRCNLTQIYHGYFIMRCSFSSWCIKCAKLECKQLSWKNTLFIQYYGSVDQTDVYRTWHYKRSASILRVVSRDVYVKYNVIVPGDKRQSPFWTSPSYRDLTSLSMKCMFTTLRNVLQNMLLCIKMKHWAT